jgi:Tol biopolymer transport system component
MALLVVLTGGAAALLAMRRSAGLASPERLAFVAGALGERLGLYWADPEGNARRALTEEAGDVLFPSWSPDGEALLCVRGSVYSRAASEGAGVYLLHLNGAGQVKPELIYSSRDRALRLPLWSPDGTRIALLPVAAPGEDNAPRGQTETNLLLIDMADRQVPPQERVLPLRITSASASWSADGARLALVGSAPGSDGSEEAGVYVYELASAALTRIAPAASEIAWSPAAPLLACANLDEQPGLTLLNADGSVARTLESAAYITGLAWSPDGSRLVAGRNTDAGSEVALYEVEAGAVTVLAGGRAGMLQWLAWSPGGDYVAYTVLVVGDSASDVSGWIEVLDMRSRQSVPFRAVESLEAMPTWRPLAH